MCVIAYKKPKINIDLDTIEYMFEANPHGAGLAVILKDKTIVSKGYMTPEHLWQDVKELQDLTVVLHFRLATHGQINEEMTHPFIIDQEVQVSTQLYAETDSGVLVHNGILSTYGNKEISDTCDFVCSTLAKLENTRAQLKLLKLTNSKYILIDKGKAHRVGQFEKYKGLHVSNTHFVPYYGGYDNETNVPNGKIGSYNFDWQDECSLLSEHTYSPKKR